MDSKEIRLGFGGGNVRLLIPLNWSVCRYYWKNREWPIIGVYGFDRFIEQRDQIMELRSQLREQERQLSIKNERLRALGKELSAYKRGNKQTGQNE